MKKRIAYFLLLIVGCSVGPKPIAYGEASCHFCSMTIVDKQHASQLVTDKGKVFNFDAMECMLNHMNDVEEQKIGILLTNTYNEPEELFDATKASYLISKNLPSPMGEFLTAFDTLEEAQEAHQEHGGQLYTWPELKAKFER